MSRITKKFSIPNKEQFVQQLLLWSQSLDTFLWLDSNEYPQKYSSFDKVLAVGVVSELKMDYQNAFNQLDTYQQKTQDYLFGYLSYDLKNDTEDLVSNNKDFLHFPDLYFFQPKKLFFIRGNEIEFQYNETCKNEIDSDFEQIKRSKVKQLAPKKEVSISQRIAKEKYLSKIKQVQKHIQRGDTYEVNFCMEYYAENQKINPLVVYQNLNAISKPPFASFFKNKNQYLLSASPERFIRKEGQKVISQPIKGTAKRGKNKAEDKRLIAQLNNDPKERSENIMIVDLVRNDLSKTATKSSVEVAEFCKVYTFKQVHQLISTVVSKVKKEVNPVKLLKSMYPMGSMTGAPKISTMKIIEELEETKRGLYSGSIGYFTPNGNFDFNVVIRSILYNAQKKYISYMVGGAITAKSIPEKEYQECLLKAEAMKNVLS